MNFFKKYGYILFGLLWVSSGMQSLMHAEVPSFLQSFILDDLTINSRIALNCAAMATLWLAGRYAQESIISKEIGAGKGFKAEAPSNIEKLACSGVQAVSIATLALCSLRSKEGLGSLSYALALSNGAYAAIYLAMRRSLIMNDGRFIDIARNDKLHWTIGSALVNGYLVMHYKDWFFGKPVG